MIYLCCREPLIPGCSLADNWMLVSLAHLGVASSFYMGDQVWYHWYHCWCSMLDWGVWVPPGLPPQVSPTSVVSSPPLQTWASVKPTWFSLLHIPYCTRFSFILPWLVVGRHLQYPAEIGPGSFFPGVPLARSIPADAAERLRFDAPPGISAGPVHQGTCFRNCCHPHLTDIFWIILCSPDFAASQWILQYPIYCCFTGVLCICRNHNLRFWSCCWVEI